MKRLDGEVTAYLTHLQEVADEEPNNASYLVFGLQLLYCRVNKTDFLVSSKEALAGWKKRRPGGTKFPVPEEFVADVALQLADMGEVSLAFGVLLQTHCYLRPSELLSLTAEHVCFPSVGRYKKWALIVAPSSLGEKTKTGRSDDSVLNGDLPSNHWMAGLMALYMKGVQSQLFPGLTLRRYETLVAQAAAALRYKPGTMFPHVFRHAGPSNDLFHKRRDLAAATKRGRWESKTSVRRYEKHGLLVKQWEKAPSDRHGEICRRSDSLVRRLAPALRKFRSDQHT